MRRRVAGAAVALTAASVAIGVPAVAGAVGPPDAGHIVWTLGETGGPPGHLVTARSDGSDQRDLTPVDDGTLDIDAALSPDGRWVTFERQTDAVLAEVRMVPVAGGASVALDLGCSDTCVGDGRPTWIGANRVSFTRYTESPDLPFGYEAVMWSVRVHDGRAVGALQRVSPPGGAGLWEDYQARPTPDGRYLVFMRIDNETGDGAAFRMRRDGSGLQQLTPFELEIDLPDPSPARVGPTAGLVVFQTYGEGNPQGSSRDLATVPVDCPSLAACSAAVRFVTHNGFGSGRASNPAWSPDGTRIAYAGRPSSQTLDAQIVTIAADGSDARTISTSPRFDYRPDWGSSAPGPDRAP